MPFAALCIPADLGRSISDIPSISTICQMAQFTINLAATLAAAAAANGNANGNELGVKTAAGISL
jgi:hypothetical protein